jgi:hypothetical protein
VNQKSARRKADAISWRVENVCVEYPPSGNDGTLACRRRRRIARRGRLRDAAAAEEQRAYPERGQEYLLHSVLRRNHECPAATLPI